ncbi:Serine carboxypeptidase, serine active site,Alpha/Beta hydrolase fold,Peptidase S10, serine [Cinara cedri]|uniref:Carboxypeptidase n=1 Tax=Cinara cedri TaxID=506608 RepID=A0A5E4MFJ7_9HEMI|nr:Serine carboxypeptidase, serine active site,Alpha/Beta hydrolase fold,Peptidase S10, serine [Cinara cedri]
MLMAILRCIVSAVLILTTLVQHCTMSMSHTDDGALYLTPMIRAGHIVEARNACKVVGLLSEEAQSVESYSGYLTVDDIHNSNLFFWFFPAMNDAAVAPVILWLQGGPGIPSLYGLFEEHGPFSVSEESGTIELRNHTWVSTHSMLYVDNPVGTGFSFTTDDGYNKDQAAIGRNMYEALLQFFKLFSEYQKNDFFIAGESYAGKYVPTLSYIIHQKNPDASIKINLKGIAIGNGFIDPVNQVAYGKTLYQYGVINENEKRKFEELEHIISNQIKDGNYTGAHNTDIELFNNGVFKKLTGLATAYNVLSDTEESFEGIWTYVSHPDVRAALHVGERLLNDGCKARTYLLNDEMQSVSPCLGALLDTGLYRVLLYSGQLDIIVPYSGTVMAARSLRWSGAERFKNATRTIWRVRASKQDTTDVAGYATTFGPLTMLLVRNTGHMVPSDHPVWAHEMITRFTSGKPFQ